MSRGRVDALVGRIVETVVVLGHDDVATLTSSDLDRLIGTAAVDDDVLDLQLRTRLELYRRDARPDPPLAVQRGGDDTDLHRDAPGPDPRMSDPVRRLPHRTGTTTLSPSRWPACRRP